MLTVLTLMSLELQHIPLSNGMDPEGRFLTQIRVLIGMIALNAGFTVFLLMLDKTLVDGQAQKNLEKQSLLRVLAHDIANPISIIAASTHVLQPKNCDPIRQQKMMGMIDRLTRQVKDILETVRQQPGAGTYSIGNKILCDPTQRPRHHSSCCFSCLDKQVNSLEVQLFLASSEVWIDSGKACFSRSGKGHEKQKGMDGEGGSTPLSTELLKRGT